MRDKIAAFNILRQNVIIFESLYISSFSLHFLLIFSFSLYFLAARMPQFVQPWSGQVSPMLTAHHAYEGSDHDDDADIDNDNDDDNDEKLG